MASVLSDINDLAAWPPFLRRVTAAVVHAAVDVGAEEFDGTQYRIARRALATNVFAATETWGERFAWGVAANPVITAASTDGDVQFTVNSLWDAMAGAMQQPGP